MVISDLMTKRPMTATVDSPITDVADMMNKYNLHGIPVVDDDNKVVGIVTESDFFIKGSMPLYLPSFIDILKNNVIEEKITNEKSEKIKKLLTTKVADIMSSPCTTINQNASLEELFSMIKKEKLHSVPVVDTRDKLVGIITLADIMNLMKIN